MKRKLPTILFSTIGMMILILDSKTALQGTYEGVELCVKTVIPSLFPFFVLSIALTASMAGSPVRLLAPLSRLCGIPSGAESILLTGFLGGYPIGAQCVAQSWQSGQLSKEDAHRMLGFCSNAGPAFIFGITGSLFESPLIPWSLWIIQIVSAIFVGMILPGKSHKHMKNKSESALSASGVLNRAIGAMAGVCGWVILFRMIIAILRKRVIYGMPTEAQVLITGILELTNGCCNLNGIESDVVRYVLCSTFLSFGGICVAMQTASATAQLGIGQYFRGKVLQSFFSGAMAIILLPVLFPACRNGKIVSLGVIVVITVVLFRIIFQILKNNSSIRTHQRV